MSSFANQRAVLAAEREARIADGWEANEIGSRCPFFFARRVDERIMVAIERDPHGGKSGDEMGGNREGAIWISGSSVGSGVRG